MNPTDPRALLAWTRARSAKIAALSIVSGAAALWLAVCLVSCSALSVETEDSSANSPATFGSIEGTVHYLGQVPKAEIPDNAGLRRDILEVDDDDFGLRYAVVYLVKADSEGVFPPPETSDNGPRGVIVVDQRDLTFVPHLLAVRSGQRVAFSNSDPENHNVRAQAGDPRNRFNILTGPGLDYERRFRPEPDRGPIRLSCDIHAWMSAWVYAFDHPLFDVTDDRGGFRVDRIPTGSYRVVVHQPDGRLRAEGAISVVPGTPLHIDVEFSRRHLNEAQTLKIDEEAPG